MRIAILSFLVLLTACGDVTSPKQDQEYLQKSFSTVYQISVTQWIVADSLHVYHVTMTQDGQISTKIRIK